MKPKCFHLSFLIFTCFSLLITLNLEAQDLSDTLSEVLIQDTVTSIENIKNSFATGNSKKKISPLIKSFYNSASLSTLLNDQSSVFIKSYGVNSLHTLNIRGSSSAQSQVMWQGVPINDVATGISDLSLYGNGLFEDIDLQYGGNGALYGSGNVGGAVFLSNNKIVNRKISLRYNTNHNLDFLGKYGFQHKDHVLQFTVFGTKGRNNFRYKDANNENALMQNADINALGTMISYYKNLKIFNKLPQAEISFHSWAQKFQRAIPPALFESSSLKQYENTDWKNNLSIIQPINKQHEFYINSAFNQSEMGYQDPFLFIDNQFKSKQLFLEFGFKSLFKLTDQIHLQQLLFFPLQNQTFLIEESNNKFARTISSAAYIGKFIWIKPRLEMQLNTRWEKVNENTLPLVYGFNIANEERSWNLWGRNMEYRFFVSAQKSYRLPTLNEWYYQPGGNPFLKPEYGWNLESGMDLNTYFGNENNFRLYLQVVNFNRWINDWIYWMGGSIWTPHNIAKVYSKGWDWQLKLSKNINPNLMFNYNVDFTYTIATTQHSDISNDKSIGKQIPYSPRYILKNNFLLQYKNTILLLNHQYTGYRFTTMDEAQFLDPFQIWNIHFKYSLPLKLKNSLLVHFEIENLANERYQLAFERPMPGRSYNFGLQWYFL